MANEDGLRVIGDFEKALDFNQLYEILRSKKEYRARIIIDQIARIREDLEDSRREGDIEELTTKGVGIFMLENESLKKQILSITKKEGLRTKVIELAIKEII